MERLPVTKTVFLGGANRPLTGLYEEDTYFREIGDGSYNDLFEICRRMLPRDAGIWDIGANIGVTALVMASALPDAQIIAVEAGNANFRTLQKNILDNNFSDTVIPIHAAVADKDGEALFLDMSAYGFMAVDRPGGHPVEMLSAQTLKKRVGPSKLDFMKIDIEGYERLFMQSASDIWKEYKPLIHMEFNGWAMLHNARTNPIEFMEWILDNFSEVYMLESGGFNGAKKFHKEQSREVLHEIIVMRHTICDLLICDEPGRIDLDGIRVLR